MNHYPQDIEYTVQRSHEALRSFTGAAFPVDIEGEECLGVVQEIGLHANGEIDCLSVMERIREAVAEEHDLSLHAVALVRTGTLPRTSSGKIQRYACRQAFLDGNLMQVAQWRAKRAVEPHESESALDTLDRTSPEAIQAWLVSTISRKLGVESESIEPARSIAQLGFDSVDAMNLAHSIECAFNTTFPLDQLLDDLPLTQLSEKLSELVIGASGIVAESGDWAAPMVDDSMPSRGQKALWFIQQLDPGSTAYNVAAATTISGSLDIPSLVSAMDLLVERHPLLRATLQQVGGQPAIRLKQFSDSILKEEDGSSWDRAVLEDRIAREVHRPFDLESGPLLRVKLFKLSTEERVLLLVAHHIVVDFWSLGILLRELGALYYAGRQTGVETLEPLNHKYAEYVRWQEALMAGPAGEELWRYWERHLSGAATILELPADRPRPAAQTFRGESEQVRWLPESVGRLRAVATRHHATVYMVMLAAFECFLCRYTGQEDILVGTPVSGRGKADFAGIVGYFLNPLVMRAHLSGNPSFDGLVGRARDEVISALGHADFPFTSLVERLQPVRDTARSPLFQVMFMWQKSHLPEDAGLAALALNETGFQIKMGSLVLESRGLDQKIAQFDLTLIMAEIEGSVVGSLQYNSDLFDRATVRRMARNLESLVNAAGLDPHVRISELQMLSESEQHQLVLEWNGNAVLSGRGALMHERFQAQAGMAPDSIAVAFGHQQESYGSLNRRANQIARYLRRLGVGPECPVGICVQRSPDLIAGLFGILKAGGYYVPLDPKLPLERMAFILKDAGVQVLLTEDRLRGTVPLEIRDTISLDSRRDWLSREQEHDSSACVSPANACYLIYTSGSTGRPKGVVVTHRSVDNFLASMDSEIGCGVTDTLLALTNVSFDISVLELFWTLSNGSKVALVGDQIVSSRGPRGEKPGPSSKIDFSLFYFASQDSPT
ncbi:MAG: condensation domain-containing protein, partial [Blastocatellia bacterium]